MIHLAIVLALAVGMKPSDLHHLRSVREVAIRPDGSAILYTELDPSGKGHPESRLMVHERESGAARVFRRSGLGGTSPRWSPDGEKVALLGVHDGDYGLVVTDAGGGNERLITRTANTNHPLPSSGNVIDWSPDSRSIAFVSATPGPEADEASGDPVVIRRVHRTGAGDAGSLPRPRVGRGAGTANPGEGSSRGVFSFGSGCGGVCLSWWRRPGAVVPARARRVEARSSPTPTRSC